ncbi:hypothetical protein N8E89_15240 [Phyllobacterium sp. A18/5-2]|jgi:hypothetical protein|uniref:hypothetical protein n=1 Tax=Phyllobacterium sp. A18/5-2 TaxID=2978392 RepID=UPI0021C8466E|nr:hypothetical protein [Phyllobacterium sp. A18/5-2]UXN63848.1 hypothetical protein N8E89_15240 [Phyllobacterium sp. A18/5-2]
MTAGHSPANPAMSEAIVTATDGFARQVWPCCSSLGVVFDRFHAAVSYLGPRCPSDLDAIAAMLRQALRHHKSHNIAGNERLILLFFNNIDNNLI